MSEGGTTAVMTTMRPNEPRHDPFAEWCMNHPYTLAYIALVVTILLVLNMIQVFVK